MSKTKFHARIWLDSESVDHIEVWVDELEPTTDMTKRPSAEWVHAHFEDVDRNDFLEEIGQPKNDPRCWQILMLGTLDGFWSHSMNGDEFEEVMDVEKCECEEVPAEWFIQEPVGLIVENKSP